MGRLIKGLHHVTSIATDPAENNRFFTGTLGMRRVKKTVNFDAPEIYHLYYGDAVGTPGSLMTCFPFGQVPRGTRGAGEVGITEFAVPSGALPFWQDRFGDHGVSGLRPETLFGEARLRFEGPDGDGFALVETDPAGRTPWTGEGICAEVGILGLHGARLRLRDTAATGELLAYMGYQPVDTAGTVTRYQITDGNAANTIDLEAAPEADFARQGAGSVHHIAFAVEDRAAQSEIRRALLDAGYQVTPVIDRDYFWAVYFNTPGGVLFEIATHEPGFEHDEDRAHLGEALKLPERYRPYREQIKRNLPVISD